MVDEQGAPGRGERRPGRRADFESRRQQTRYELEDQVRQARAQFDAANDRINQRTGRNLLGAILIGLALGGAVVASLIFVKEIFMVLAAVLVALTASELASALRTAGRDVPRIPIVLFGVAAVPVTYYAGVTGQWLAVLAGIVATALWRCAELVAPSRRAAPREVVLDLAAGAFIHAYVVLLGTFAVLLLAGDRGQWWLLAFVIVVATNDIGAYASGLLFGKHPMAPRISPKKTWEGFAGAAALGMLAGMVLAVFMLEQPWWLGLLFGLALVISATGGDLAESMLKRDLGVKDMSTWLPGHGGFLDRLDSALPSTAVTYAFSLVVADLPAFL